MRTDKRTQDTPWQAIDTETDDTLGWYSDSNAAYIAHGTVGVSVLYRPSRKKVTK